MFRSIALKLGFIVFPITSLTYIGSSMSSICTENQMSAMRPLITPSSCCCLSLGAAFPQLSVLLLLSLLGSGRASLPRSIDSLFASKPCSGPAFPFLFKSLEDLECSSLGASFCASNFAGVLSVCGRDSSSIVLPRGRVGGLRSERLRSERPCRCRSLRFC